MDKVLDKGVVKDLMNERWLVMKQEKNTDSDKQNKCSQSVRDDRIPPLKLVRHSTVTSTTCNSTKLQDCNQKLDKAKNSQTTKEIVVKHCLPVAPPPQQKKHSFPSGKVESLKVSLKPNLRILASLRNRSIGTNTTITITKEEEQILALVKTAGLTLEHVRIIAEEINDDDSNQNVTPSTEVNKIEYSNMKREYFEKIREGLLQSKDMNKQELLPFLYFLLLDNHDCVNSLFCLTETNEDMTQLPVSSRECIFKALKYTMVPDTLQKVRKLLRDHILGTTKVHDELASEERKFKANETQTDAHLYKCSVEKRVKYSPPVIPSRITTENEAVLGGVKSNTATATITRPARSNLPVVDPMSGPSNSAGKRLGQSMAVNQMNTQKVVPSLGYVQNNDASPRYGAQQPRMYPAQNTAFPQPANYRWDPATRQIVCFPNSQWNTSQY
ncbi:hypothetical protein EVAR_38074_1 [Eumeta japonica]|uniref:Uncharacterized protein n=1 Tax=Eumeta variegata TaxID=151549 RepID=A0A4C1W9W4_EUMVA|nr:hypothetical protein EVAR_38074_1 [Eumeta japonica]